MSRWGLALGSGLLLGFIGALSCGDSSSSEAKPSVVVGSLSAERHVVDGAPIPVVHITVPVLAQRDDLAYANIAVDGTWLKQNVPVMVVKTAYGFYVPLDPAVTAATVSFALTPDPLTAWNGSALSGGVFVSTRVTFAMKPVAPPPTPTDPFIGGGGGLGIATVRPLTDPPAPAAPDEVMHENVPNTSQGKRNTCVPHSIASSVGWLARKYNYACKFDYPGWQPDGGLAPGDPLAANAGNAEMAEDLLSTYQSMGSFGDAGVNPPDIIKGKKKFLDSKGLGDAIETTRIPTDEKDESGATVYAGVKEALKAGCAVELVLRVHQNDYKFPDYTHMVAVVGYRDTGSAKSIAIHDSQQVNENEDYIRDDEFTLTGTKTDFWPSNSQTAKDPYASMMWAIKQCPKADAGTGPCDHFTLPPGAPVLNGFKATFAQTCFCTTYAVSATDPRGGTLHYAWTNSNACGQFTGGDSATAVWTHPDSTNPGACPNEPIHPATITVVIRGDGGSLTCVYAGGSGAGTTVTCTPNPK